MPGFDPDIHHAALLAIHVGCVVLIVLAVLTRRRGLRPPAVAAGAAALWLPLFALTDTLGRPNPYPPEGDYKVIASKLDKDTSSFYMFVDTLGADPTPRVYAIRFDPHQYERFEQTASDYEQQVLRLTHGGGNYEVTYVDYMPPDLLKDGLMRGWQAPRETD